MVVITCTIVSTAVFCVWYVDVEISVVSCSIGHLTSLYTTTKVC